MPFIQVNTANLYYETFGVDVPGRVPIVLIHGSTGTGKSNWSLVAPILARSYRVIVPDCRGHGQSENPKPSYSFKEMADDTAALIRLLGYERAHVIGHSNGGNVALVTLLEHPEVIQTAIPQAANAWVSPDLPEKEPSNFNPERVSRENPAWMNEMINLHGPTHGPDYWRHLLKMTLEETITQPNYTIQDLKRVQRPTLVIQGENDSVNAHYKHAQFIALNIPDAELWIPQGIGHNVQDEVLFSWIDKVLDFLGRRGNDAADALYRLGRHSYPDRRLTVFDLHAEMSKPGEADQAHLTGRVLTAEQCQAAVNVLSIPVDAAGIKVLLDKNTPWALVKRGVSDLRRGPDIFTERISQALFGEIVHILEEHDGWAYIQLDHDNYLGWIQEPALHRCTQDVAVEFRNKCNSLVRVEQAVLYSAASSTSDILSRLPFGVAVYSGDSEGGFSMLNLPGNLHGWTPTSNLLALSIRPQPDPAGIAQVLTLLRQFIGVPYLWGGRTPFGYDCSGLAQTFMRFLGVRIPRDADQQYYAGIPVEDNPRPGDLLFFGNAWEPVPNMGIPQPGFTITHVAISLGGDLYIHSNGAAWSTSLNSFDPHSPCYRADLHHDLVGVRRFIE
jgi:gamma-D-glutamyl-L-lysine dipeptidyl-peptidase